MHFGVATAQLVEVLVKGRRAIDVLLAPACEVEVGSVDDFYLFSYVFL